MVARPRSRFVGGAQIAQGAQAARQVRQLERVPAEHVDVVPHEGGKPGGVPLADIEAVGAELGDGGTHVRVLKRTKALRTRPRAPIWSYPN